MCKYVTPRREMGHFREISTIDDDGIRDNDGIRDDDGLRDDDGRYQAR